VDRSLGGRRVVNVLDRLAKSRSLPETITTDNGPEFQQSDWGTPWMHLEHFLWACLRDRIHAVRDRGRGRPNTRDGELGTNVARTSADRGRQTGSEEDALRTHRRIMARIDRGGEQSLSDALTSSPVLWLAASIGLLVIALWSSGYLPFDPVTLDANTGYVLSATSQSLAAVIGLTLTASIVVVQLSSRYFPASMARFLDGFTVGLIVMFLAAVLLPLWVLTSTTPLGVMASVVLGTVCLFLLVPFAFSLVRRVSPIRILDELASAALAELRIDPNRKPRFADEILHVSANAHAIRDSFTFAHGCDLLAALAVSSVIEESELQLSFAAVLEELEGLACGVVENGQFSSIVALTYLRVFEDVRQRREAWHPVIDSLAKPIREGFRKGTIGIVTPYEFSLAKMCDYICSRERKWPSAPLIACARLLLEVADNYVKTRDEVMALRVVRDLEPVFISAMRRKSMKSAVHNWSRGLKSVVADAERFELLSLAEAGTQMFICLGSKAYERELEEVSAAVTSVLVALRQQNRDMVSKAATDLLGGWQTEPSSLDTWSLDTVEVVDYLHSVDPGILRD